MRYRTTSLSLFLLGLSFIQYGCGDSKQPAGPDTGVPVFSLEAIPPEIAPLGNTMLSLLPLLPLDFEALDGKLVLFTGDPDSGVFSPNQWSRIDLDAATKLFPEVWYQYTGLGAADTLQVALFAHVLDQYDEVLAWNSCLVAIVPE